MVVIIIAIIAFLFMQSGSSGNHEIIFHFEDGSTSTIPNLGIEYEGKNVISVEYNVLDSLNTLDYTPYYETPLGTYQLETRDNGTWKTPIYKLINYNVEDGFYNLTLVPDGSLKDNNDNSVTLPDEIEFMIHVQDDRTVGIIVG